MKSWILIITLGTAFSFSSRLVHGQDLPYISAKLVDDKYEKTIRSLVLVYDTVIDLNPYSEKSIIQLYIERKSEPENWLKAVLRVGSYYSFLDMGTDPAVEIKNILGSNNDKEIIINTGFYIDIGGNDINLIIRTFKNLPFTITELPTSMGGFYTGEHWTGNLSRTIVSEIRKKGGMIYIFSGGFENNRCYYDFRAIYPSGKGLKKSEQIAKRKVECAG